MGKDNDFRKLVELIFAKKLATKKEILSPESSVPICLQINDFYPKLRYVLFIRHLVITSRWAFIVDKIYKMLESHELYVTCILQTFYEEHRYNQNAFDAFLSACCIAKFLSEETFEITNVDLSDLNFDLIMVFYDSFLKKFFSKRGGLQGFVEHVRDHKYLTWQWDRQNMLASSDSYNQINRDTIAKLLGEFEKEMKYEMALKKDPDARDLLCIDMTERVLSTTSVKLPTFPSKFDLVARTVEFRKSGNADFFERKRKLKSVAELEVLENLWKEFITPDPDSSDNQEVKENEGIEQYESIIQGVIRHNCSRSSDLVNLNNPILKEAEEILERLETNIESLIEVLDDFDKE